MDLNVAKAVILTALFLVTFLLTMLPLKLVSVIRHTMDPGRRRVYKDILGLLNCFGGGVFLAACLLDLFPDVRERMGDTLDAMHIMTSYPIAEFVMVFGFFLVFIMEQVVLSFREDDDPNSSADERQPLLSNPQHRCNCPAPHHFKTTNAEVTIPAPATCMASSSATSSLVESKHSHNSIYEPRAGESHPALRALLLMMALSLHSLFEGLALGLQTSMEDLAQILVAVVIHKSVIAFSLGLNLVQSELSVKVNVMLNVLFSVTTPIGVASGIAIMDLSHSVGTSLVSGILQGIACGTFLFVTFFEVLPHEMNSRGARLPKVLATIIGFSAVAGALFLDNSPRRPSCYGDASLPASVNP